jgi:acyl-CoA thioesterase FadM
LLRFVRVAANLRVRLLRRILRASCAAFLRCFGRPFKVGVDHLQVMLQGDAGRVAQPRCYNVDRIFLRQFRRASGTGTMDLEHHIWFINLVMADSQICIYARMVARSAKMIHYLMFMINESTGKVAAHFECVNALVDLQARKTAPYPAEILTRIDAMLAEQSRLAWAPPISGAMRV